MGQQQSAATNTTLFTKLEQALTSRGDSQTHWIDRLVTTVSPPKMSAQLSSNSIVTRITEFQNFYEALEKYLVDIGCDLAIVK